MADSPGSRFLSSSGYRADFNSRFDRAVPPRRPRLADGRVR